MDKDMLEAVDRAYAERELGKMLVRLAGLGDQVTTSVRLVALALAIHTDARQFDPNGYNGTVEEDLVDLTGLGARTITGHLRTLHGLEVVERRSFTHWGGWRWIPVGVAD